MDRAKTICIAALLLAGCHTPPHVTVASKNFTEQVILGEIFAQQIEGTLHLPVERKLNLGGTLLAHQALTTGSIDVYPEYTGTALTAVLKQTPGGDAAAVFQRVSDAYRQRWKLEWLRPLGFNDTFAMVISNAEAQAGIRTLSQAARAHAWKLGAGYEFLMRPDGLPGLARAYGLRLESDPITMDLGLLYAALAAGKVQMVAGNSTDGLLSARPLTILEDDRHYFPPYECSAVVRQQILDEFPQLRPALEKLSGRLNDETMRKLNYAVDGQHRRYQEVAAEFLRSQ